MDILNKHFRPEFLNRIDEIIIFHPLNQKHILQIIEFQLKEIAKRLSERAISLKVTPATKKFLSEKGYDPVFGARPLKRALQKEVLDRLALMMIKGEIAQESSLEIDAKSGRVVLRPLPEREPVERK